MQGNAPIQQNILFDIYVDGSFIQDRMGYAALILKDNEIMHQIYGPVQPESIPNEAKEYRQVVGELVGIGKAVQWCLQHQIRSVRIFYDYLGIEKWATGQWKAKNDFTARYANFIQNCGLSIQWRKVKSHSGNTWNEQVDRLAKEGAKAANPVYDASTIESQDAVLLDVAEKFARCLTQNNLPCQFEKILNHQFARLKVQITSSKSMWVDIYNTPKKPFSPYIHGAPDNTAKSKIMSLWKTFRAQIPT